MIGYLKGNVILLDDPYIIVDVNGVGYKVLATKDVLSKISSNQPLTVFTYTHVKEDALELYGFSSQNDLKLFELLIGVSGVGPKTAINVFAIGNREEILNAIVKGDVAFFQAVPRLGKKNAQKIIIELKSKIGDRTDFDLSLAPDNDEVIQALKSFGFTSKEAVEAIKSIKSDGSTEQKIKQALKYLGK